MYVQTINTENGVIDLTQGPFAKQYEAAVRYVYGWIENRVINATKANMRTVQKGPLIDLVDSASDDEDSGMEDIDVEDSDVEESEETDTDEDDEQVAVEVSEHTADF